MAEEAASPRPAPKSGSKRILVMMVVAALLGGGAVAAWLSSRRAAAQDHESVNKKPQIKQVVHLEGFVVNLADPEERSFLRVGIDLGLEKELGGGGHGAKPTWPTSQIRDAILGVLGTWKAADLLTSDGKTKLKEQLLAAIQERAPELGVREVYFTDFLVQR